MQYFVSSLVLQWSWWGRESWLLCFNCLLDVLWLLVFCGSSSRCFGLICSVWMWYFLIILTFWRYFLLTLASWKPTSVRARHFLKASDHHNTLYKAPAILAIMKDLGVLDFPELLGTHTVSFKSETKCFLRLTKPFFARTKYSQRTRTRKHTNIILMYRKAFNK